MPDNALTAFLDSAPFTPWRDPRSGITSHILGGDHGPRLAAHQQSFYYTNRSLFVGRDAAGRQASLRYWFYCFNPPEGSAAFGRTLGSLDLVTGELRHYPETSFSEASPLLDSLTGDIYWANPDGIRKLSYPDPAAGHPASARSALVARFPASLVAGRQVRRYATHLTLSADRRALGIDTRIGDECFVGQALLDGSGQIEVWEKLSGDHTWNHAQFHPRIPGLLLFAQDFRTDSATGRTRRYQNRMWTIQRGRKAIPVYPENPLSGRSPEEADAYRKTATISHVADLARTLVTDPRAMHGHEWWSADGDHICYIHYQTGIERIPLARAGAPDAATATELVWPHDTVSHAHSNTGGDLLVLDALPPDAPDTHHVRFVNLNTRRTVDIVSRYPAPDPGLRRYHVHPHPQFCADDRLVCYTTTVLGRVDVAFVRVAELIAATENA
ncbi:MAG: oligogalacturonate lyase family protein [Opitutaceae bacterium]|jgi:hypothetical protein|nr:oligogalacturonate lyase family protein [Opitutaceae bacterium]